MDEATLLVTDDVAIERPGEGFTHASADTILRPGDIIVSSRRLI